VAQRDGGERAQLAQRRRSPLTPLRARFSRKQDALV
jgi:hypothetical protein